MRHWLAYVFLILCVLEWGCKAENREAKEKETQKAYETQHAQLLDDFSQTYNADATWQKSLKREPLERLLTMTVQDTLIRPDGRPIAGFVGLRDVQRRGSNYIFYLAPSILADLPWHLIFELECSIPDFKPPSGIDINVMEGIVISAEYMFAARIHNVRREVLNPGAQIIASGECLGLKYIGDNKQWFSH